MEKSNLKETLKLLLSITQESVLKQIAKKIKIRGIPKKINDNYKKYLINQMLNSKNIIKTEYEVKILYKIEQFNFTNHKENCTEYNTIINQILKNLFDDKIDENEQLIKKVREIDYQAENKRKKVKIEKQNNKTIVQDKKYIKLAESKEKRLKNEIKEENNNLLEATKSLKDLTKRNNEITKINENLVFQNEEQKKKIINLKEKIAELNKRMEANTNYYKKKIKKLQQNRIQEKAVISDNNKSNIYNSSQIATNNVVLQPKLKKRLLIQAPSKSDLRRQLRLLDIEVIESKNFSKPMDKVGKIYDKIDDIPKVLRYDKSEYTSIYILKNKMAIGDRDKIKCMFGQEKVIEIDDIGEIKND